MKLAHVSRHMIFVAMPLFLLGGATSARADEEMAPRGWVGTRAHHVMPPAYGRRHGPAVYGWRYRAHDEASPATNSWNGCGVYHYWNGESCVDARDIPPSY
jgi:hypothetical protein